MNFDVYTGCMQQILKVSIRTLTDKPIKMWLVVCDAKQNNTVFTKRYNVFKGEKTFFVRLPLSPVNALVQIYNDAIGNRPKKDETTFEMVGNGIERIPLEKKMDVVDMANPAVKKFVKFAQRMCYYMGVIEPGMYESDNGKDRIRIDFKTVIMRNGKESSTPALITEGTRIIDVSQKIMVPFTVPMRMAILCHEFAHCYLNSRAESEIEADLQALLIYLGLGFPRIEAHQAFTQTFQGAPSELNSRRYKIIEKFIDDFENNKFLLYE